jgi:signal transduction histidine kinase
MVNILDKLNIFGEFKNLEQEKEYLNYQWDNHKKVYLLAYFLCCLLLLLAGIFTDYKRVFITGSADSLTISRVFLLLAGIGIYFKYKEDKLYPKSFNIYALSLSVYSSLIILALNIMTGGMSKTMLPGSIIITVCYYVLLPNKTLFAIIPAIIQFFNITIFYDSEVNSIGNQTYINFLIIAINIVMLFFKIMQNKNSRTNYLLMQQHKEDAKAKETILGIIGHDLKNPLTVINLKLHFAKILIETKKFDKLSVEIEKMEKASNNLAALLQSLLTWATSGQDNMDMKTNCITSACNNTVAHCQNLANQKGVQIQTKIEDQKFVFDSNMMETIIRNILVNAIKFTPKEKMIYIKGHIEKDKYILEIQDQGIGMDDKLAKQLSTGTNTHSLAGTDGEQGAGLGMRLTYQFIEKQNAALEVKSVIDQGTTFKISFNLDS